MKDQLLMFGLTTSEDTDSAISSQESEAGRLPSDGQEPKTSKMSGPDHVPVSRFRSLDSKKAMPTNDTSGPLFTASSPSASLQSSLENRLRQRMDVNGSPECVLIWNQWDMPAGPPICRLAASVRRTAETGFGLLPTPSASEHKDHAQAKTLATLEHREKGGGGRLARRICGNSTTLRYNEDRVGLNPSFACWMMGYPPKWENCAPTAMPSSRKSQRNS